MPRKRDPDRSHGEKVLTLFIKLLSGRWYSTPQLESELSCSTQTVGRLIDTISRVANVESQKRERRNCYRLQRPDSWGPVPMLSADEMEALQIGGVLASGLGFGRFASPALEKAGQLARLADDSSTPGTPVTTLEVLTPGTVDYAPFIVQHGRLVQAIRNHLICDVEHHSPGKPSVRRRIKPLAMFYADGTIYVHALYVRVPGLKVDNPAQPRNFALQRIDAVELTEQNFEPPKRDQLTEAFRSNFGLFKDAAPVIVRAHFTGWAAGYVAERRWSEGQTIQSLHDGGLILEFTTESLVNTVTELLRYGDHCQVLSPPSLIEAIKERLAAVAKIYTD